MEAKDKPRDRYRYRHFCEFIIFVVQQNVLFLFMTVNKGKYIPFYKLMPMM